MCPSESKPLPPYPAISAFAQTHCPLADLLAMEATSNTWALVEWLETRVARVVVSNPLTTKAIASAKVKTDKIDARRLANMLRCGYCPKYGNPTPPLADCAAATPPRHRLPRSSPYPHRQHQPPRQQPLQPPALTVVRQLQQLFRLQ